MQPDPAQTAPLLTKSRHFAFCFLPHISIALLALGVWRGGYYLLIPALFLQMFLPLFDLLTGWKDNRGFQENDFSALELKMG